MDQENLALLEQGLGAFGITPSAETVRGLAHHLELVAEWNNRINLTAIKNERDMVLKHAVDSVSASTMVKLAPGMRVIDVGTGAGFPGIPFKCLTPGIDLTLLDSLNKRCKFLEEVGKAIQPILGFDAGYQLVWGRAEDMGKQKGLREQFDLVVARAVAEFRVLAELCLPFCRIGGEFLAMKGPAAGEELAAAEKAIAILGGEVEEAREISLPEDAGTRTLIRVKKVKPTPPAFPRRAGTPEENPL